MIGKMCNETLGVYFKSPAHGLVLLQLLLRHFEVEVNHLFVKGVMDSF